MNNELKPCPFCGGEAHSSNAIGQCFIRPARNGWHVYCGGCQTLFGYDDDYAGIYKTAQQAINAWNTRHEQEPRTLMEKELWGMINCPVWCEMQPKYYKCGVVGVTRDKSSRERIVIGFSYGFEWIEDVLARTSGKVYDRQPTEVNQ